MEAELARAALASRGRLEEREEGILRYSLSLCRSWHVRAPDGGEISIAGPLRPFRARLVQVLWPLLDPRRPVLASAAQLGAASRAAAVIAQGALSEIDAQLGHRLPRE